MRELLRFGHSNHELAAVSESNSIVISRSKYDPPHWSNLRQQRRAQLVRRGLYRCPPLSTDKSASVHECDWIRLDVKLASDGPSERSRAGVSMAASGLVTGQTALQAIPPLFSVQRQCVTIQLYLVGHSAPWQFLRPQQEHGLNKCGLHFHVGPHSITAEASLTIAALSL